MPSIAAASAFAGGAPAPSYIEVIAGEAFQGEFRWFPAGANTASTDVNDRIDLTGRTVDVTVEWYAAAPTITAMDVTQAMVQRITTDAVFRTQDGNTDTAVDISAAALTASLDAANRQITYTLPPNFYPTTNYIPFGESGDALVPVALLTAYAANNATFNSSTDVLVQRQLIGIRYGKRPS